MDKMPSTDRGSLDGSRDTLVELDVRESSNFEITLFWDPARARDRNGCQKTSRARRAMTVRRRLIGRSSHGGTRVLNLLVGHDEDMA
jgi:hypothetical protein